MCRFDRVEWARRLGLEELVRDSSPVSLIDVTAIYSTLITTSRFQEIDVFDCYHLGIFSSVLLFGVCYVVSLFASAALFDFIDQLNLFGKKLPDDSDKFIFFLTAPLAAVVLLYFVSNLTANPNDQLACAEKRYLAKKEIVETRAKVAEIEAMTAALDPDPSNNKKIQKELKESRQALAKLHTTPSSQEMLEDQEPIDDRSTFILSALWLGVCFFLQRIFEKMFHDKGYALLAVCAAGFLLAFFSANYFLLGGSVTGGLMGSAGRNNA